MLRDELVPCASLRERPERPASRMLHHMRTRQRRTGLRMTKAAFHRRMRAKFAFTRDGYAKLNRTDILVIVEPRSRRVHQLRSLIDVPVDETALFQACAVAGFSGGDELVHVTEPGRYFDQVFYSDHEELFTIGELGKEKRLAKMPFLNNPIAKNLKDLFDSIQLVPRERVENGILQLQSKKAGAKEASKFVVPDEGIRLENRRTRKFWHLLNVYGVSVRIRAGTIGNRGRLSEIFLKSKRTANAELNALVDQKRAAGFVEVPVE